jgi:hypothetical protein
MAKVISDDLWFCVDCTMIAENGDDSGMEPERAREVRKAIAELKGSPAMDSGENENGYDEGHNEFSKWPCECCGSPLAGERYRFALLK